MPTLDFENALKYAGRSDDRQVRQVLDYINLIKPEQFPFARLFGGTEYQPNGNKIGVAPVIKSQKATTLTPELYDYNVSLAQLRMTADTAAKDVDDSITLVVEDTAGVNPGQVLNKPDQDVQCRVDSITNSTTLVATVIRSPNGSVAWTKDANDEVNLEVLATGQADGHTVGYGYNREPIQRITNLQFNVIPMSVGYIQQMLNLYAQKGDSKYKQEKMFKMTEMQRQREAQYIAGRKKTIGSGSSRVLLADGLLGWAGTVFNNTDPNGELPYDRFNRALMPKARAAGGGQIVYGVCGNDVLSVFAGYADQKARITSKTGKYGMTITEVEGPGGILKLIAHAFMDTPMRRGQLITFQPDFLCRPFLEDVHFVDKLNVGNEFADRAAIVSIEGLIASTPDAICLHTNILK